MLIKQEAQTENLDNAWALTSISEPRAAPTHAHPGAHQQYLERKSNLQVGMPIRRASHAGMVAGHVHMGGNRTIGPIRSATSATLRTFTDTSNATHRSPLYTLPSKPPPQAHSSRTWVDPEVSRLVQELERERLQHEKTRKLLASTAEQLRAAEHFLSQTDSCSYADIRSLAKDLNHQISQLAASMVDKIVDKHDAHTRDKRCKHGSGTLLQKVQAARTDLPGTGAVGRSFFDVVEDLALHPDGHDQAAALMHFSSQSRIVIFCYKFLNNSRWSTNRAEEEALEGVYQQFIQGQKKHCELAGRWRTLTREVCRLGTSQTSADELAKDIQSMLKPVLTAFGFFLTPNEWKAFLSEFYSNALSIANNLLRLDIGLKEQVSTMDILPLIASPESPFDPEFMENRYSFNKQVIGEGWRRDKVLVPSGLGLTWTKHMDKKMETGFLLKAEVILSSVFDL